MLMARLQKERDTCQEEVVGLQERIELQASQVSKAIRDKDSMTTELEVIKERWDKAHSVHQKLTVQKWMIKFRFSRFKLHLTYVFKLYFQLERDDAMTEIEILKEKLDKAIYSSQKSLEEKESAHKEYEKMLEKYDRYICIVAVVM